MQAQKRNIEEVAARFSNTGPHATTLLPSLHETDKGRYLRYRKQLKASKAEEVWRQKEEALFESRRRMKEREQEKVANPTRLATGESLAQETQGYISVAIECKTIDLTDVVPAPFTGVRVDISKDKRSI